MDADDLPDLGGLAERRVPIDWEAVETWLRTPLPRDYRDLCDRFGSLYLGDWVWVHAPVQTGHQSYDRHLRDVRAEARDACDASGLPAPVFHPKRGGLLPFGGTRGGEGLFWDTSASDPDDWTVVVLVQRTRAYGTSRWLLSGLPLASFLEAMVTTGVSAEGTTFGPFPAVAHHAFGGDEASPWQPPDRLRPADPRRKALSAGSGLPALRVLVPPPEAPTVDFSHLAERLGGRLPTSYVQLMTAYGPGTWGEWLRMSDPGDLGHSGVLHLARQTSEGGRVLRDQFPDMFPMPLWPEEGGFFGFASSIDGDVLGWMVRGTPDTWPLAWQPRHEEQGRPMAIGLSAALLAWLRGTPVDRVFPHPDPDRDLLEGATFEPVAGARP